MIEKMKDSGIEWIGEIPDEWGIVRTLNMLEMPITDGPHTTPELYDDGVPFVSAEAVSCGNGKIDFTHIRGYISQEFYEECCRKYMPKVNDIYMIKSGATTGKIAIVNTNTVFTIWSPLAVFRCDENKMLHQFMFYSLQADYFQKQVELGWTYGTQQNIGMRTLEHLKICHPSLSEQQAISDFLDKKVEQIDDIHADLNRQVGILNQYKKSLITEAVTKGLNPDAEMKDSGIDWIGEIPKKWKIKPLKYLGVARNGLTYSPDNQVDEGEGILVMRSSNIQDGKISLDDNVYVKMKVPENLILSEKDLLICSRNGSRNLIGKNALITKESAGQTYGAFMCVYRSKYNEYIHYVLNSDIFTYYLSTFLTSTINQLTNGNLYSIKIPFPFDKIEQKQIVDYLDKKCTQIDDLIIDKQKQIEKMENYKKSLIYEYVTGKKRVRV